MAKTYLTVEARLEAERVTNGWVYRIQARSPQAYSSSEGPGKEVSQDSEDDNVVDNHTPLMKLFDVIKSSLYTLEEGEEYVVEVELKRNPPRVSKA